MNINKKLFFIVIFIFACISIVTLILGIINLNSLSDEPNAVLSPTPIQESQPLSLSPTSSFDYSPAYKENARKVADEEKEFLERDQRVSQFIDTLPYKGTAISVEYFISNNQILVTIQKDKQSEGNKELDEILQKNGITERSWIRDLVIQYR